MTPWRAAGAPALLPPPTADPGTQVRPGLAGSGLDDLAPAERHWVAAIGADLRNREAWYDLR